MEQSTVMMLPEVLASSDFRGPFLDAYAELFSETGEGGWGEQWTAASAAEKFEAQARVDPHPALVHLLYGTGEDGAVVRALCLGYVNTLSLATEEREFPPGLGTPEHRQGLAEALVRCGADPLGTVMSAREFGVRSAYRTGLDVVFRTALPIYRFAAAAGASYTYLWTSRKARLWRIVRDVVGYDLVYEFGDPMDIVVVGGKPTWLVGRLASDPSLLLAETRSRQR